MTDRGSPVTAGSRGPGAGPPRGAPPWAVLSSAGGEVSRTKSRKREECTYIDAHYVNQTLELSIFWHPGKLSVISPVLLSDLLAQTVKN